MKIEIKYDKITNKKKSNFYYRLPTSQWMVFD